MVHDSACDVLKLYMSTSYIFNQSWHLCYQITLTLTMESLSQFEILKYTLPTKSHACVTNVIISDNLTHKSVDICNTNTKSGDNLFMCCRIVSETLRKILQVVSASGSSTAMASMKSQVFNQNTDKTPHRIHLIWIATDSVKKTFVLIWSRFRFILISLSSNFTNVCFKHDELRNGVHTDARSSNNPRHVNVSISDVLTNHLCCEIPPNTKEFVDLYSASASISYEIAN